VPEDAAQLSLGGEISVATTSRKSSVKKNAANSNPPLATKLSKALGALANDLPNPADESTDYFHPFVAPLASSSKLSPETIKQALKVGASYRIDLSSADDFFSGTTDESNWGSSLLDFVSSKKSCGLACPNFPWHSRAAKTSCACACGYSAALRTAHSSVCAP
jgi:hypothetical protein